MEKRIAIVGAGISGLLACKYAMEKGFNPIVFEARSSIGGVWPQTIESTTVQTPKSYYRFSDFAWLASVTETFPYHNQVMEYLKAYALHFNILPRIKFNSRVLSIGYATPSHEDMLSWHNWGGTGEPFSPTGKWNITIEEDRRDGSVATQVYEVDFVILCTGIFSGLPNIPHFPKNKGPEVFDGKVIHSMDYAAMDSDQAAQFIKEKRVTVVGFQKSAVDLAAEVVAINGVKKPCTLLFRAAHWTVPQIIIKLMFQSLNRFSQLTFHKPDEGFLGWLLAFFLFTLIIFSFYLTKHFWMMIKLVESYLKWRYPLKKYDMIPNESILGEINSCILTVLPENFYSRVEEGSLILKKSRCFSFCKKGLIVDGEDAVMETDVVIFATGYKGKEKLANIFSSTYFQRCISESSAPFHRDCIHPRIPQLAILGHVESYAGLHAIEIRSMWIAHLLAGKFRLPPIREMEDNTRKWEKWIQRQVGSRYRRSSVGVLLQIYSNDQLCRDMGYNPRRKSWFLPEVFSSYGPSDYKNLAKA